MREACHVRSLIPVREKHTVSILLFTNILSRCIFKFFPGHVFAAKFIPISHAMEKALIRKEIDIMNHLHHNKLINLHDAFEDEDEMVLIFEL